MTDEGDHESLKLEEIMRRIRCEAAIVRLVDNDGFGSGETGCDDYYVPHHLKPKIPEIER